MPTGLTGSMRHLKKGRNERKKRGRKESERKGRKIPSISFIWFTSPYVDFFRKIVDSLSEMR